jgi:hypothetical protein
MNRRDLDVVDSMVADECTYRANGAAQWNAKGRDAVLARFRSLLTAFPDQHATVTCVVDSGRIAAAEIHLVETHAGPLTTPLGVFAPTGLVVDEVVAYFVELDGQDHATSIRHYYDGAPLTLAIMSGGTA